VRQDFAAISSNKVEPGPQDPPDCRAARYRAAR
jgi:hypothetical protein